MRIAICLSGQIRTWKECYESWFRLIETMKSHHKFSEHNIKVDFFIHTWDFNTVPPYMWNDLGFPEIDWAKKYFPIEKSELEQLIETIKPIKYLIETSSKCESRKDDLNNRAKEYENDNAIIDWAGSQLYSIMRCGQLKRDYEIENNFEYDACIKLRFDGEFTPQNIMIFINDFNFPLNKRTIYSMHSANVDNFPHDLVGDIFFYSDSQTYDVLTSFYKWLPTLQTNLFFSGSRIELIFGYYIRMFDIKNIRSTIDVRVIRSKWPRIAICFVGQIRTGVEAFPSIKRYLGKLYPFCDFFIHSWDINTSKNYNGTKIKTRDEKVSEDVINKIKEIYSPKKILIENYDEKMKSDDFFTRCPPFWYSFMKSGELKKQYEIENAFQYDYAVRARLDLIFHEKRNLFDDIKLFEEENKENGFYIEGYVPMNDIEVQNPNDIFYISRSKTMSIASNYYNELQKYAILDGRMQPYGYTFDKHLRLNNIEILDYTKWSKFYINSYLIDVLRKECIQYSPLDHLYDCIDCDRYYFRPIDTKDCWTYSGKIRYFINDLKKKYILPDDITNPSGRIYYLDELDKYFKRRRLV